MEIADQLIIVVHKSMPHKQVSFQAETYPVHVIQIDSLIIIIVLYFREEREVAQIQIHQVLSVVRSSIALIK